MTVNEELVAEIILKPSLIEGLEKLTYNPNDNCRLPMHLIYWYTFVTNITLASCVKASQSFPILINKNVLAELY